MKRSHGDWGHPLPFIPTVKERGEKQARLINKAKAE